ncbi:MAG TPA: class I SAM-dependent methyltransferase, partial [Thermodesulfovibrionales bacterium]|nr:class I SAM-dependent methyltransferase [Thermodesulfovibrionales bacterium]
MDLSNSLVRSPVGNEVYDAGYFRCHAGGASVFERFIQTGAAETYPIYHRIIRTLKAQPNEGVLDVGCGRGEVIGLFAMKGLQAFGVDFSIAALQIASTLRDAFAKDHGIYFHLIQADATALPFPARYLDHIVLSDIVEHLHDWQLDKLYSECWRVLRPHGKVVVHTWPNLWHTKYTYPLVARISRLLTIPRHLNHRKPDDQIMHVNEQSLRSLRY